MWCHIAVPHGWKNKAFLVNLNDVGPEVGLSKGTIKSGFTTNAPYNDDPYYFNSVLAIRSFPVSGAWSASRCGERGGSSGRWWMTSVCSSGGWGGGGGMWGGGGW